MHEAEARSWEVLWGLQRNLKLASSLPIPDNGKDFYRYLRSLWEVKLERDRNMR